MAMDLFEKDISPENLESFLKEVIEEYKVLGVEKVSTGGNISELYSLLETLNHSDDDNHNGETVLQHTREVLEDVIKLTEGMDENIVKILKLTAIFHDVGKAYTFAKTMKGDKEKNTFYKHARISAELLEKLVQKELESKNEMYEKLAILVKSHDDILQYLGANQKDVSYVKNLLESKYYKAGLFDLLKLFVRADSQRAKTYNKTEEDLAKMDKDIALYNEQEKEKAGRGTVLQQMVADKKDEIISILQTSAPELVSLYPDIKEIRKQLGNKKMFGVMKDLNNIIPAK